MKTNPTHRRAQNLTACLRCLASLAVAVALTALPQALSAESAATQAAAQAAKEKRAEKQAASNRALAAKLKAQRDKDAIFQSVLKTLTDLGMSPTEAATEALALAKKGQPVASAKNPPPATSTATDLPTKAPSASEHTEKAGTKQADSAEPATDKTDDAQTETDDTTGKTTPPEDRLSAGANTDYPRTFFHAGIAAVNPYKMDASGALDRSQVETRPFIEFIFNHRWAWRQDEASEAGVPLDQWKFEGFRLTPPRAEGETDPAGWLDRAFTKGWDIQTRFGYTFTGGGSNAPTASTLGSGEFHVEGVLGRTFARYVSLDRSLRMSSGPEVSGGFTTEHKDFEVHPHLLAGWGWTAGGKSPLTENPNHRFAYTVRAGYAWLDTPALDRSGSTLSLKRDATGQVEYDRMKGGLGVETELFYPLSKSAFLTAGGRVYALRGNDAWSFYIGYVQNIDKLLSGLFP